MRAMSILTAQSAAKSFLKASNRYLAKHPDWSDPNLPDDQGVIDAREELAHQLYQLAKGRWAQL